jgi:hypothetical protein
MKKKDFIMITIMRIKREGENCFFPGIYRVIRIYEFATTFFPLWAGVATDAQAKRVVENLAIFERQWGIVTSTKFTGCQWDGNDLFVIYGNILGRSIWVGSIAVDRSSRLG